MVLVMVGLGLTGGFIAGLLGIGGGIIMLPLMLYIPPVFGLPALGIKDAAALTVVQSLFASLSGVIAHRRRGRVDWKLAAYLGLSGAAASLAGSWGSSFVHSDVILIVFAILSVTAAVLMFISPIERDGDSEKFSKALAVVGGLCIGGAAGIVGQGGAFLYVPLMIHLLKIPTRVALGSSLVISALTGFAGFLGRAGTGQIDYFLAGALIIGAIPAAQLGGWLSSRLHVTVLRRILGIIISITAFRMLVGITTWFTAGYIVLGIILIALVIRFCQKKSSNSSFLTEKNM